MKKKLLSIVLCTAMVATMLAGCAKKAEPAKTETETKTETKVETETKTEEKKEEAPVASGLTGEVVYWSMWNETEPQAEILKGAIADFSAANPDVKVTVEWTGRTVKDLVLPGLESGTQIDLFDSDPSAFYGQDTSKLMNLDDFYASNNVNGAGTVKDSMIAGLINWDAALATSKGLTGNYSVPYAPYVISWFYNKDLFAQAGITALPTTWAEFEDVCAKLKAAGINAITVDDAYISMIYSYYLARALGAEGVMKLAQEGKDLWKDPLVLQCLKDMENFASKGYFSPNVETNKYPAGQAEFASGQAAMYFNASWFPSEVKDIAGPDFPWGQFAYPEVPNGLGKISENSIGGQAFCVHSGTKNKEAAYELLKHFVSEKTQAQFLEKGLVPCTTNTDWPATVYDQKVIVGALTKNINWNASFGSDFVDGVANGEFIKVLTGKQTADQAIEYLINESAKY